MSSSSCRRLFFYYRGNHFQKAMSPLAAGVSSLISLLTSAREEDQPKLSVLLCEAVVAVYLSLLIHGLGMHNSNELFRLGAHPLNNRMWAAVFGGGAKVIIKPKRPELPPGNNAVLCLCTLGLIYQNSIRSTKLRAPLANYGSGLSFICD